MLNAYEKFLNKKLNTKLIAVIFAFAMVYTLGSCSVPVNHAKVAEAPAEVVEAVVDDAICDVASGGEDGDGFSLMDANMLEGIGSLDELFAGERPAEDAAEAADASDDVADVNAGACEVVAACGSYDATEWDEAAYPGYYRVAGEAIIAYDVRSENGGIVYNGLDGKGRTTWAAGYITSDMRADAKARGRQDFDAECDKITGWGHNGKVTIESANGGKAYNGYMFNRSHLIADSLGGDPIRENLVTGTRCQNVGNSDNQGGMAYAEEMARDYLDTHDGFIYYAATPVYVGDEMVPRSVYVDIRSDDETINLHIEVFNVAKGFEIDYMTGEYMPL